MKLKTQIGFIILLFLILKKLSFKLYIYKLIGIHRYIFGANYEKKTYDSKRKKEA